MPSSAKWLKKLASKRNSLVWYAFGMRSVAQIVFPLDSVVRTYISSSLYALKVTPSENVNVKSSAANGCRTVNICSIHKSTKWIAFSFAHLLQMKRPAYGSIVETINMSYWNVNTKYTPINRWTTNEFAEKRTIGKNYQSHRFLCIICANIFWNFVDFVLN